MSGRYSRRSVDEYEDEGLQQAITYFRRVGSSFRPETLTAAEVRAAIDNLPDDATLQATMADFWLGLTKDEARWRRNNSPPPSPFVKSGRSLIAEVKQIADWDARWLAQAAARVFAKSGSSRSRRMGDALRTMLPWVVEGGQVVLGTPTDLPRALLTEALKHPERLSMKWMTVESSLGMRWVDVEERRVWLRRFQDAANERFSKLESLYMQQAFDEPEDVALARPSKKRL